VFPCNVYRLWLTPSAGGKPETLSCYDFEPTGTNDLRSLVAKVNRKLSRNQFKGLHLFFFVTTKWSRKCTKYNALSFCHGRFYVGTGGNCPQTWALPPKSLVTAAVCSSKTSKQLYRGRFLEVGVVNLVVLACVLRATTKKGRELFCLAPKYFSLELPLHFATVCSRIVRFLQKCSEINW